MIMEMYVPSLCAFNHCLWHNIQCSKCEFCSSSKRGMAFYIGDSLVSRYGIDVSKL